MKVLFFNTLSAVRGGTERMLMDTSVELLQRDHEVSLVVAYDDRRAGHPEFWPGKVNRYYLPQLIAPAADRYSYNRYLRTSTYLEALAYLQDIVRIEDPDVIHVHNFPSIEILKAIETSAPIVRTFHGYDNLCENRLKRLPDGSICPHPAGDACRAHCGFDRNFRAVRVRAENTFMKRRFKKLLAVSGWVKGVMTANGFPGDQVEVLPNFTRLLHAPIQIPEENTVLFVGRFTPEKGLLELVRSAAESEARPKILAVGKDGLPGGSPFVDRVVREAAERHIEIELQEWSSGEDLRRAYARAAVVAFSSVWPDPFGLVGIESMAQGKPVVAFDCGGVREWLTDQVTGFLVPHQDTRQFARCLDDLLGSAALRRNMGRHAQHDARRRFSPDAHIERLLAVYAEVLNENEKVRTKNTADRPSRRAEIRYA